ncbi:MAG TPA: hypothetical protein VNT02_14960 [Burkholderiales bacterium]|nr:hypothetical protein [Burkholderiales bacterium]
MSTLRLALVGVALVATMGACATGSIGPPPKAEQPDSAGIGLDVQLQLLWSRNAAKVYFVKLDGASIPLTDQIIASNYAKEGRVYLLNATPGEYAAVAASFTMPDLFRTLTYTAYFPRDLAQLTRVTVHKGHLAFAGRYAVNMTVDVCPDKADDMQLHYSDALAPGAVKCGFLARLGQELRSSSFTIIGGRPYSLGSSTSSFHYSASLDSAQRDAPAQNSFLQQAASDLADGGWSSMLR